MAVSVKTLLACLLATHVASQVLANSVLAKQYSQEVEHGISQTSKSMQGMMYSSTVVLCLCTSIDKHYRFSFLQNVRTFCLKMGMLLIVNPRPLLVIGHIELLLLFAVTRALVCFTTKTKCAFNLELGVVIAHLVWVNTLIESGNKSIRKTNTGL